MGDRQKPLLLRQSGRVLHLLTKRDKTVFWLLVVLRFAVNLMDIAGIALMAVAVNFLIAAPGAATPLSGVFELLGMHVDARGSKLPALFAIGIAVVFIFIFKAVVSLALMAKSANQISALEVRYAKKWMEVLTDSQGRFNALPLKEDIAHVVTAGTSSVFQRTLVSLSTLVAESAGLIAIFSTLCFIQPIMTIGVLVYFGFVGYVLQAYVGKKSRSSSEDYSKAHVAAIRSVREVIENANLLFLSGRRDYFINRFYDLKTISSKSQTRINFLTNFPRYVVETALIVGAFGLAGGAFVLQDPLAAATTLTFFLTAATRMTPSLLNVMGAMSVINTAEADTNLTEKLLGMVGLNLAKENS